MNPSHYAESIGASTMLLRDTAPWLEKPYTLFSSNRSAVEHSMSGCAVGNLIGDVLRRNRTLAQLGNVTCTGHGEGGMCTCKTGAGATRHSADRAGSHGRRGFVGCSGRERAWAMAIPPAIVCESLVARNRVLRSTDLHGFAGPLGRLTLKGVRSSPDGVALGGIWCRTDWLVVIEGVPDNAAFESKHWRSD